jgi:hypothetical protein
MGVLVGTVIEVKAVRVDAYSGFSHSGLLGTFDPNGICKVKNRLIDDLRGLCAGTHQIPRS